MNGYPDIRELVPHAGPMVLLDALVRWAPGEAECRFVVRAEQPFVRDGRMDTAATIEHMGQAIAACLGYEAFRGGEGVKVGVIIGCRRLDLHVPALQVGDQGTVVARRKRGHEEMSQFECEVRCGDRVVSSADLTVYHA
ncbi:MAG: hypothetical protein ACODAU_13450 [Myxococcota bacterium]